MGGCKDGIEDKSSMVQSAPGVYVHHVIPLSKVASMKHAKNPSASDIVNEYLDTLNIQSYERRMHFDSLYELYKTYRTSNASHNRDSDDALERLKSFINTKLRRNDNINKLL